MARTLSIFDLWGDMIANPTKYGNSAMREARAKQLENIQNSEANLIDNTYRVANMHRQLFANRYASNITNNYYRWIAGGGTPDSFFKAQFAAIDADPEISGVDQETRAMIYGNLQKLADNVAYNLYGAGQEDAANSLLQSVSGYGVPKKYTQGWQTEQLMNLYGQGQQGQNVDLASLYQVDEPTQRPADMYQQEGDEEGYWQGRYYAGRQATAQQAVQQEQEQAAQSQQSANQITAQMQGMSNADLAKASATINNTLRGLQYQLNGGVGVREQIKSAQSLQQRHQGNVTSALQGKTPFYRNPENYLNNNLRSLDQVNAQLTALKKQESELQEAITYLLQTQQALVEEGSRRYPAQRR